MSPTSSGSTLISKDIFSAWEGQKRGGRHHLWERVCPPVVRQHGHTHHCELTPSSLSKQSRRNAVMGKLAHAKTWKSTEKNSLKINQCWNLPDETCWLIIKSLNAPPNPPWLPVTENTNREWPLHLEPNPITDKSAEKVIVSSLCNSGCQRRQEINCQARGREVLINEVEGNMLCTCGQAKPHAILCHEHNPTALLIWGL